MAGPGEHANRIQVIHLPLVWLDPNVHDENNAVTRRDLKNNFGRCAFYDDAKECKLHTERHTADTKYVLIVSGQLGSKLVPLIHDRSNIESIYVYCLQKEIHEQWAIAYAKVRYFLILSIPIIIWFN
jgi:hypothetical protein